MATAVIVIAVGLWVYSVRSGTRVPHLVWFNNAGFEINPSVTDNPQWSFGGIPMCTDKAGPVTITSLTPQGGDGQMKFVAVAVRPTWSQFGASQRPLTLEGFPSTALVTTTCAKGVNELGATFKGPGSFTSLQVNYTSGGTRLHLKIPWGTKICPPGKAGSFCN